MAKSLTSILSQIERLQAEAAAIQSEVVARIRKDIANFGLTAEQLFGKGAKAKMGRRAKGRTPSVKATKAPKYADNAGNSWGGFGKRPEWLRQALAQGRALEEFLIAKVEALSPADGKPTKARAASKSAPRRRAAGKKRAAAKPVSKTATKAATKTATKSATKPATPRKPRTKAPAADAAA